MLAAMPAFAIAQTGAVLMLRPFEEQQASETDLQWMSIDQGTTDGVFDADVNISVYDVSGRARFDVTDPDSPRVGYAWHYIDVDTADPRLPDQLSDQSVAVGFGLFEHEGWKVGATLGAGYAGDNGFDDAEPWYAKANLIASRELDADSSMQLLLSYDGNRTIFPDLPLPGFVYNRRANDQLSYSIGVPFSQIVWTPTDKWRVTVSGAIPSSLWQFGFDADATYELVDDVHVFASIQHRMRAFSVDTLRHNKRLFFEQRRAEAGVRWSHESTLDVTFAGGYAFYQQFQTGFDSRDLHDSISLSDEPYVRVSVGIRF
ncbi:MAG: hypothetical protein CMJ49_14425 [Planctomycetaceae bacterium]|nr:hypothetical protein [Planctomycetaceae bacterium]